MIRNHELFEDNDGDLFIVIKDQDGQYVLHRATTMRIGKFHRKWEAVRAITSPQV